MIIDLSTEAGYDIAAAIRGPDFSDENLKSLTTAVIRHFCGCAALGDIRTPVEATQTWNSFSDVTKVNVINSAEKNKHFIFHVVYALKSIDSDAARAQLEWLISIGIVSREVRVLLNF